MFLTLLLILRRSNLDEESRYYPLLRGINDVPSKGDPVLLCTIGNTNYYLGPLATDNNSPTWNTDPLIQNEHNIGSEQYVHKEDSTVNVSGAESPNFDKSDLFKTIEIDKNLKIIHFETNK